MKNTYFISDAHIGTPEKELEALKEQKLLSFLEHVGENGQRLFIVGDLFDFWFEYKTVIPRGYTSILYSLWRLKNIGVELHYLAGNHDFWMQDYLPKELGIRLHFDELDYTINGKRFYILHGDGLARNDRGYRMMKRIFRNRTNIFLYSLLHPNVGIPLAKWVSSLSRQHNRKVLPQSDDEYIKLAQQKFDEGYDYTIFGHLHSPRYEQFSGKIYINLGDWIRHFSYAVYDGNEIKLLNW